MLYSCKYTILFFSFTVLDVRTPYFNMTSYIELNLPINPSSMWMEITFKPASPNGYLFYSGNSTLQEDFLSISLIERRLEVRYELGSGNASLLSEPVELNVWHTMFVTRRGQEVFMRVDSKHYGPAFSPGSFSELNVQSGVGIGGLSIYSIISNMDIMGFTGCIRSLVVSFNEYSK